MFYSVPIPTTFTLLLGNPMESGTMLAHYRIADLIGKGGMGEVYRAH